MQFHVTIVLCYSHRHQKQNRGPSQSQPKYWTCWWSTSQIGRVRNERNCLEGFSAGIAASTKKSYESCSEKYARFCREKGVTPYPTSESRVCDFVAHLFEEGLAGGSVKVYLAAIRFTQIALGLGAPSMSDWTESPADYTHHLKKAQGSMGGKRRRTDAVGNGMHVFLQFLQVVRGGGTIGGQLQPRGALECGRCQSR